MEERPTSCSRSDRAARRAPTTWLIFDDDTGFGWTRVEDGVEPADIIDAERFDGDHVVPDMVLMWLRGQSAAPVGNYYGATAARLFEDFGHQIRTQSA